MNDNETVSAELRRQPNPQLSVDRPPAPGPDDSLPATTDPTSKLVADLIGCSQRRAAKILADLGSLNGLAYASEDDLRAAAIPASKARLICAAFEIARQSIGSPPRRGERLAGSSEVWLHMRARLSGRPVEEFWVIALDVRHRVMFDAMLAKGSLTGVEIHPRDVFRPLIKAGAAAAIFVHNHPSGESSPSRADVELTTRLREVGDLCGIVVLDHVVVGFNGFHSFAESGWR